MLLWGIIFFSNAFYQFSLFTGIRNTFISDRRAGSLLSGIYCLGIDPKIRLILKDREEPFSTYDLIAEGIQTIGDYARLHPERRIVAGIDFAFAAKEGPESLHRLVHALAEIPGNMFIVFGGILINEPGTIAFLRSDLLGESIVPEATSLSADPAVADRFFLGNIHYLKGSIRSGFEGNEDVKAAVGYIPLYSSGTDVSSLFCSLPLGMFIVGEIMERNGNGRFDFWTDFAMGLSRFDLSSGIGKRLEEKTGRPIRKLVGLYYYNFFTRRNISDFEKNFLWLSNHSNRIDSALPVEEYFAQREALELLLQGSVTPARGGKAEYFFIAPVAVPEFLLDREQENDLIITPASGRNAFTYEVETVDGVMAHIMALSNLRNRFFTTQAPLWAEILLSMAMIGGVFFITWYNDLFKGLLLSILFVLAITAGVFLLFLAGHFIALKISLALSVLIFVAVSIARFIFTARKQELYAMIAGRVFSPSQMKKLMDSREAQDWQREKIIHNGILMVLFPKKLPSLGESDEEAESYTRIYERYLSLVFAAIEKHGGSHDTLSMDGVLGFWNVPVWEEGSEIRAFSCARECLELVHVWQEFIDGRYGDVDARYTAAFDICLHRCSFYAGCLGKGDLQNYTLSGTEVNFAISAALSQTKDERSTILITEPMMEDLGKPGQPAKRGNLGGLFPNREDGFTMVGHTHYGEQKRLFLWEPGSKEGTAK